MSGPLPIVESCEGCGACCRVVTQPPFVRRFDGECEEAWERLRWDRPDLLAAFLEQEHERKQAGAPSFGTPCHWFDPTLARCRHYEYRPKACREFALGGADCHDARRRAGLAHP